MNKVTVWAERKVNIGDYEGRSYGVSYTREQINNVDHKAVITESASMNIPENADVDEAINEMITQLDKVLDAKEDMVRITSNSYKLDFDTLEKLHNKGLKSKAITKEDKRRTRKKASNSIFDDDVETETEVKKYSRITRKGSRLK